jgi:opacity protein-like surface antigen
MLRTFVKISLLTGMTLGMFSTEKAWADSQFIYLGAEPVLSWTHFNWQNADTSSNSTPDANGETVMAQNTGALQAGLFIGYGVVIDWIYLDVEGATQLGKRSASSTTLNEQTQEPLYNTQTMSNIYTVDFRPGFLLGHTHSVIYGIAGFNTAKFTASQENSEGTIVQDNGGMRRNGLRFGGGYSLDLGKFFMVRVEYVYTKFSDSQFTDTVPNSKESHTWDIGSSSSEVNAGLALTLVL